MASRRTKKDKIKARENLNNRPVQNNLSFSLNLQKSTNKSTSSYTPELSLPIHSIKADLTRTLLVTILALLLQVILYVYLQKEGWNKILPLISKISL